MEAKISDVLLMGTLLKKSASQQRFCDAFVTKLNYNAFAEFVNRKAVNMRCTTGFCLDRKRRVCYNFLCAVAKYVPVAQLDRVSDSDSEGRAFESRMARHKTGPKTQYMCFRASFLRLYKNVRGKFWIWGLF